jgi:hypothetical protein
MLSRVAFAAMLAETAAGQDLFLSKSVGESSGPCELEEFRDSEVCVAKRKNDGCTGSHCWSCDGPLVSTDCVKSAWVTWRSHRDDFAHQCPGELVRFGQHSGVDDCGVPCFGCSYIRACCDDCSTILKVVGQWERISCTDVETKVSYSYGVSSTETSSWSRTETWTSKVSFSASTKAVVAGVTGEIGLTAESSHELEKSTSESWSVTTTEKTEIDFTQPAQSCSWHWRTVITDSCGTRFADSRDFILTTGLSRGNSPCCLPGIELDESGNCRPDNAGHVVNLC